MIKVMGASAERIPLKDLNENIYYRQKRIFSDVEFAKSIDLQRAIKSGKIVVLEESKDHKSDAPIPEKVQQVTIIKEVQVKEEPKKEDTSKLDMLLEKIDKLESRLSGKNEEALPQNFLNEILNKIKDLEQKISLNSQGAASSSLIETLKSLEDKISSNKIDDSVIEKIKAIVSLGGEVKKDEASIAMETYVPNIRIEDANTHIKLNTRTIDKSDDVSKALEALKKIKDKK
jgi:hypothetical protein